MEFLPLSPEQTGRNTSVTKAALRLIFGDERGRITFPKGPLGVDSRRATQDFFLSPHVPGGMIGMSSAGPALGEGSETLVSSSNFKGTLETLCN